MIRYFCLIFIYFLPHNLSAQVAHKRLAPKEVKPVIYNNIKYTAPTYEMGYIVARDVKSDSILWRKEIYRIYYIKDLETDVQDVFIDSLYIKSSYLIIHTENKRKYKLKLQE
jgi:hypothetical protein